MNPIVQTRFQVRDGLYLVGRIASSAFVGSEGSLAPSGAPN